MALNGEDLSCYCAPALGGILEQRDPSRLSVPWRGTLAACSLATASHQKCADVSGMCGLVRGRTYIRRDFWIELPSAGAYRLAAPGAIRCSNKISPVTLRKCPNDHQLTDKAYLSDIRVTNISESFTHKMAAKTSWHRYGTKLLHCHHIAPAPSE